MVLIISLDWIFYCKGQWPFYSFQFVVERRFYVYFFNFGRWTMWLYVLKVLYFCLCEKWFWRVCWSWVVVQKSSLTQGRTWWVQNIFLAIPSLDSILGCRGQRSFHYVQDCCERSCYVESLILRWWTVDKAILSWRSIISSCENWSGWPCWSRVVF